MQVLGTIRLDKKTKNLAKRLKPGEIALINHVDIDSTAARMLVEAKVAAVVNAARSCSGRYPNLGPKVLLDARIPLIDGAGESLFDDIKEGEQIALRDGQVCRGDQVIAQGELLDKHSVNRQLNDAKNNLGAELEHFAENTLTYVTREKSLLLDPAILPDVATNINGRHALVVVRGESYKEDLAIIRSYINDVRPVLIGVDGGADALLEIGLKPDIIIGDMDSVSDNTLSCGAELIVHAYASGESPGLKRIQNLGLSAKICSVPGTSEDIALLLAYEKGAEMIVAVGTHSHLIDFLDKGRRGMSSTFLVRLKVGNRLVDAKGVSKLYRVQPSGRHAAALGLAALIVVIVIIALSPAVQDHIHTVTDRLRSEFWHVWIRMRMWER
ncbi:MAG: hypothetical protein GX139_10045 [Armatimonadetes bacterium]|nr:hypothetical protein [Armatimonadota bacterium]